MKTTGTWLAYLVACFLLLSYGIVSAQPTTERASISRTGSAMGGCTYPSISADGRFVCFTSGADNLVASDTNQCEDIFVRDRWTGTNERVSVSSMGAQANARSLYAAISADGRFVAFYSDATNLVPNDTNEASDIFVHDRLTGTTERVSVSNTEAQANGPSDYLPAISADGRFVAFTSDATNLVGGDPYVGISIFVRDRGAGTTERVSLTSQNDGMYPGGNWPAISGNGRFVSYLTGYDILVYDREAQTTTIASVNNSGTSGNGQSYYSAVSDDGRFIAFTSNASNLVAGDTNGTCDVFARDQVLKHTERVSVSSTGTQANNSSQGLLSISPEGRFVAFSSYATNLVATDANGWWDVLLHDRKTGTTECMSLSSASAQGNNYSQNPGVSADGRFVVFESNATNLVTGTQIGVTAIYVRLNHDLVVQANTSSNSIACAGSVSLSASANDNRGHGIDSWLWSDNGAGGIFSPSATVQNPQWTAPGNWTGQALSRQLTVTATCDGDPAISGSAGVAISEQPGVVAPSELTTTTRSANSIVLAWHDNSNNETSFKIERKLAAANTWSQIATVGANITAYTNTGLTSNTAYNFRVRAVNGTTNSNYSNVATATTLMIIAAPSSLTAKAMFAIRIDLDWHDNSNNEAGFHIERRFGTNGVWAVVADLGAGSVHWSDTNVAPVTSYNYRLQAYNSPSTSKYSKIVAVKTPLYIAPPSNLTATALSPTQIKLVWTDNSNNESGFKIERKKGTATTWTIVKTVGANVTSFTNTSLTTGATYTYRVRAYRSTAYSDYSNEAQTTAATPKGQPY
jgi:hypothetical protein